MTDPLKAFLAILANCYGAERADAATGFAAMAPMLRREIASSCLCPECAAFIAVRCRRIPSMGQIVEAAREWRQTYRPEAALPREPSPKAPVQEREPTADERASADAMVARLKALAREHDAANARPSRPLPDVTLSRPILDALRQAAGIASPDPRIRASVAAALAVAPAMREAARRERERV